MAPFTSKSLVMQLPECYGSYYLDFAGGSDSLVNFRNDFSPLKPSAGFLDVMEEFLALEEANEPLPSCLMKEPAFIFGAYKGGPSNQSFFESLKRSQKEAQTLLKQEDFLEQVLAKIGGKKPRITCEKAPSSPLQLSFFKGRIDAHMWNSIFNEVAHRFEDEERQLAFFESLSNFSNSSNSSNASTPSSTPSAIPAMVGATKATLEGLKKARHNLAHSEAHFESLSKDSSLNTVVPKQLYVKTTDAGSGKELKSCDRVRIGYQIATSEGTLLFANHDTWLSLSKTIPGFAHGMQGMRVGEKRKIYIHPALAYGALTTLPPCIDLVVDVQLIDYDEKFSVPLPSLISLDLNWVQNPSMYHMIEESIQQQPSFMGSFYRNLLDKIEGSDKMAILKELDNQISALKLNRNRIETAMKHDTHASQN